jgi:hypothetical protein
MTTPSSYGSMIAISSVWGNNKTFRMFPVDSNCPYLECIYDPETKILVVISKTSKQSYHMLPQLDENGDAVAPKRPRANGKPVKEERRLVETYQEYYVIVNEEIYDFLSKVAINADTFDFKTFVEADPVAPQNAGQPAMSFTATAE